MAGTSWCIPKLCWDLGIKSAVKKGPVHAAFANATKSTVTMAAKDYAIVRPQLLAPCRSEECNSLRTLDRLTVELG